MRVIKIEKPKPVTPPPATVTVEFTEPEIRYVCRILGNSSSTKEEGFHSYPLYQAIANLCDDLK